MFRWPLKQQIRQGCTPRPAPAPGEMAAPGRPGPENFQLCPAPPRPTPEKEGTAPPRPENYPGARIGANVPTSSKVFGSQKLLTSIFSTKGALRRHVTYNNHPNLTYRLLARHNRPQKASNFSNPNVIATFVVFLKLKLA